MHWTERRLGSGTSAVSDIFLAGLLLDFPLDELSGLDYRAAVDHVLVPALDPLGLDAQLGEIGRSLDERRKGNSQLRLEAVFEHPFAVVLAVFLRVDVAHHQPAQALAEILEPPGAGDAHDRGEHAPLCSCGEARDQASYLNDSARRARNCTTFPSSIFTSSLLISAMRRSRSDFEATLTALRAASSHEFALVPMTSVTL